MSQQNDFDAMREEVYRLTELSLRGEISQDELAQLEHLLSNTGIALGHYLEYISQSAALGVWASALTESESGESSLRPPKTAADSTSSKQIPLLFPTNSLADAPAELTGSTTPHAGTLFRGPTGFTGSWWQPLGFVLGVLVAAIVFGVWMVSQKLANHTESIASGRDVDSNAATVAPVAFLTSSTGCAWGNGSLKLQTVGSSVELGDEIALQEGIAEFRLANGVYLSVEGPAGLVLTSPDSIVLQYGKVTAHVPWPASEFRILAGGCQLTATDAEFGVSVGGSRVDTHVFSGDVLAANVSLLDHNHKPDDEVIALLASSKLPKDVFTKAIVSQGRALAVATQNKILKAVRWEKATPALFATKLTMAGALPVSKAYVDAVLASGPKGYWRFEAGKDGVVTSEVPGISDLKIFGDLRLAGLTGNRVAEFRPGSNGYLASSAPVDVLAKTDYSVEVWVKPSHVHSGDVLAVCATEQQWNVLLIELQGAGNSQPRASFSRTNPGSIRFLHRDPPAGSYRTGTSCLSSKPYTVRRWQHVVAVKRGEQLELYIDGKLVAKGTDKTSLGSELRLVLGRQEDSLDAILPFSGQIDELAIYSRALSKDEIQAHLELIEWTETKAPTKEPGDA